jgi:Sulfotransferase domain
MQNRGQLWRIKRAIAQAGKVLTGRQMAGRGATIFPDDVYLVSYPRSGNTWTRFLLGNFLHSTPATFSNIEQRVAEIYFNADHVLRKLPRPRLLKSHEAFHPGYPSVIYIVRDPRDVAVSFYHHNLKAGNIPDGFPMDDFVAGFIVAKYDHWWGSWGDNVQSWLTMRQGHDRFLLLRYEEMKENPQRELLKIANFLQARDFPGVDASAQNLARAVDLSSPERMRALEQQEGKKYAQLKNTRLDKPFVRSAKAGGWKSTLSSSAVGLIESAWGPLMQGLGYELTIVGAPEQKLQTMTAPSR